MLPFVLDNQVHVTADVLRQLLTACRGGPVDVATAYFNVGAFELLRAELPAVGALRLLLGKEPEAGSDVGLRARQVAGELAVLAFDERTLRLVEELIAFLAEDKVRVRAFDDGFLHAKAYLFHRDRVGPGNWDDRLRPFAGVVGSSNFTRPGLTTNRELNLVHRVFTPEDEAVDREAAARAEHVRVGVLSETLLDPSGVEVPGESRRAIKSEVGARAMIELNGWFQRNWDASVDWKDELIDLLNRSKFGQHEYTPYQVYLKALYTYLKDQVEDPELTFGRTAVDLAEFQEASVKKALRIIERYKGVLVADSVGLGKTWIGLRLLEHYAYLQRMKAVVVCPASLRNVWRPLLMEKNIAAEVVGMEELGREDFDVAPLGDADVVLVDESHNFRSDKANRYAKLDELIRRRGGFGKGGERKRVILLTATPINNDLFDLLNQVRLFTQNEADYFREAGIGDVNKYVAHARRAARQPDAPPAGELLFNLLDEFVVRNTRPYIRVAYPNATINGVPVRFPDRSLRTVEYSLEAVYSGLYQHVVEQIDALSLAPYKLESYRKKGPTTDAEKFEVGREQGLVGIFKTRFLKRLESSVEAFRRSVRRGLVFEQAYLDFLLSGRVVASRDFQRLLRLAGLEGEDELTSDGLADQLEGKEAVTAYLETIPSVDLNQYDLRKLSREVRADIERLEDLEQRVTPLVQKDAKLAELRELLAGELRGRKVLIFSSYRDTARYVYEQLTGDADWLVSAGSPRIRQIDSKNHPDERAEILKAFAPIGSGGDDGVARTPIDVLISTDVLSEGQNLQDCGVLVNYDLTWNPIRLVQRNGRVDRLKSPHERVLILNMFPEGQLEELLGLVERLTERIGQIDDLGLLDSSVLGEVVHPRAFNTLRRIQEGDVSVLDEEEARAELAGPELLLKQLQEMMARDGADAAASLPDGIHSGLRREKAYGAFFYFIAPRTDGTGTRHFWRYVDARTGQIIDNRYSIAQLIACGPAEARFIGQQDVFGLQDRVVTAILQADQLTEAKATLAVTPDKVQQEMAEEMKGLLRAGTVDRAAAKSVLKFLDEPFGRALVKRATAIREGWREGRAPSWLVEQLDNLRREFSRPGAKTPVLPPLTRDGLHLICFQLISA